jgi:hypothetical protein
MHRQDFSTLALATLAGMKAVRPASAQNGSSDLETQLQRFKERWCTEAGKLTVSPDICSGYATRTEIGLATRVIRLSASTAIAISPC